MYRNGDHMASTGFDGVGAAAADVSLDRFEGLHSAHFETGHRLELTHRRHQASTAHSTKPSATSEATATST